MSLFFQSLKLLMKFILNLFFLFLISIGSAFSQAEAINDIKESIKAGSAKEISQHFHQTIDVTLEGDINNYSKTQAEYVLKEFFQKYPPSTFMVVHQGASKAGMPYAIGQYSSGDHIFRVWIRIKKTGDSFLIHEISFIKE